MEGKRVAAVHYELTLTEEEAKWLQNYVQNPKQDDEPAIDGEMRRRLWNALRDPEQSEASA